MGGSIAGCGAGSSTPTPPAPSAGGCMGGGPTPPVPDPAPTPDPMPVPDPMPHDDMPMTRGGGHRMLIPRTAPEDAKKARQILSETRATIAPYADYAAAEAAGFKIGAEHLANKDLKVLHAANVTNQADGRVGDTSAPETLVYERDASAPQGLRLIGVVYITKPEEFSTPVDLGMGEAHQHHEGQKMMQHVWTSGANLKEAFAQHRPK